MRPGRAFLRDPDPAGANGGTVTPPPAPAPAPPPTPEPPPGNITMSAAEYRQLLDSREELRRVQEAERARANQAELDRARALAERGQIEDALNTTRAGLQRDLELANQRAAALTQRVHERERRVALASAVAAAEAAAGFAVRPEARPVLEQLWADHFEVVDDPTRTDAFLVRERATLRPIADVVAERLRQPASAMFLAATNPGGTARPGGVQPGTTPPPAAAVAEPTNLGEALVAQFREVAAAAPIGLAGRRP
jgi:hypothetical protein